MEYRVIGKSGINASVIGLGTWVMGGWMWGGAVEKESIDSINTSIENGVNLIDTAPVYGFGISETVVGKAIKDKRDKVILATKCGLVWDQEKGDFFFHSNQDSVTPESSKLKVYRFLGSDSIKAEVERSLKRLDTDYIDLYQTHWQESTTKIEDTMGALLKLKDEGKIRAIGVSNASVDQMKEYGEIDSDQEKYNMFQREIESNGNVQHCVDKNIAILAYSPIAQGLLTGKIDPDREIKDGDVRKGSPLFTKDNILKVNKMLSELKNMAEDYSANIGQLMLAWTLRRKGITHLLCGARNSEQAIENAGGGEIKISETDLALIDNKYTEYFG
ncbi:MAG: aldo/keto reductase [Melioribacteraceae bacterium]|nr:aldo/keto reductase [Melioribacteraceae bacterium]MCF8266173.1 aldo/keto reductase [Melioribacteraceae bacterium]MCF8432600.1 aldo/keto reductase [Melioribacteraceae bacterium]